MMERHKYLQDISKKTKGQRKEKGQRKDHEGKSKSSKNKLCKRNLTALMTANGCKTNEQPPA
jgi:hypothetical protein